MTAMLRPFAASHHLWLIRFVLLVGSTPGSLHSHASAQAEVDGSQPPADALQEARERFDRGLALFNDNERAAALAEFRRAYKVIPNPLVLYNIGLTYAALQRPVEAVDTLETVLADPSGLNEAQIERAQNTLQEQARRIARVDVQTNVPATLLLNGLELARSPLAAPLRVPQGTHIIGATAPDYLPRNQELTVAGAEEVTVRLELQPAQRSTAQLSVSSNIVGAQVHVDGVPRGQTPMSATLVVTPGKHEVSIERPGYLSQTQQVEVERGGLGKLNFVLRQDPKADPELLGRLLLVVGGGAQQTPMEVSVDGQSLGTYTKALVLPAGTHRLELTRPGYRGVSREVTVSAGGQSRLAIHLAPTAATEAERLESAARMRTAGWLTLATGAVVTVAGGSLGLWAHAQVQRNQEAYEALLPRYEDGGYCGMDEDVNTLAERNCKPNLQAAVDRLNRTRNWRSLGLVSAGIGLAAAVTGAVLVWLGADDTADPEALSLEGTPSGIRVRF